MFDNCTLTITGHYTWAWRNGQPHATRLLGAPFHFHPHGDIIRGFAGRRHEPMWEFAVGQIAEIEFQSYAESVPAVLDAVGAAEVFKEPRRWSASRR